MAEEDYLGRVRRWVHRACLDYYRRYNLDVQESACVVSGLCNVPPDERIICEDMAVARPYGGL